MWQPSKSKTKAAVRTMEREVTFSDGSRGTSKLEVGFTQFGTITTEDQRMLYALVKQWEDTGKSGTQVFFSDRLLARLLKKSWGTNVIEALTGSLRRLRLTPLRWIKSYRRSDTPNKEVEEEVPFTILSDLKIIRRKSDGHVTNQQGYFQFDRNLLENLLNNYTKPLLLDEFFKLKSEIGQLIYSHIDLIMADKNHYERCSKDLFRDLGLGELTFYQHASHRKQALNRALKELRGIGLSTGVLTSAAVERTKDGKDYKVVFQKGARPKMAEGLGEPEISPPDEPAPVVINHYSRTKDPLTEQAEGLVKHFHKRVHGVDTHLPQPKEIGQALSLLAQYGSELANFVVDYAAVSARETGFSMQVFGAVLSYASRAATEFHRPQRESQIRAVGEPTVLANKAPEELFSRGAARLAALTEEQLRCRLESAKAELSGQVPFLADRIRSGGPLVESMVRSHVLRQLDGESMGLLPLNALKLPEALAKILARSGPQNSEASL